MTTCCVLYVLMYLPPRIPPRACLSIYLHPSILGWDPIWDFTSTCPFFPATVGQAKSCCTRRYASGQHKLWSVYLSPKSMEKSFHEHRKEKHTQVGCVSNLGFELIILCMLSSKDHGICQGGALAPAVPCGCCGQRKSRSGCCPCL